METIKQEEKIIMISGGGTGGPSAAPLALAKEYSRMNPKAKFIFSGYNLALEKDLFAQVFKDLNLEYQAFPAGKWRRYFSIKNFFDIFKTLQAFFLGLRYFKKNRVDLIISAGSFASVPLVWAAYLRGVKILVHQQDWRAGLANRLMAPFATCLSVSFPKSLLDYGKKAVLIGNPSLDLELGISREEIFKEYGLRADRPLLFITGGGTGALSFNQLLFSSIPLLNPDWQIIHQTGKSKGEGAPQRDGYINTETIEHSKFQALLAQADLVISRAGLGILSNLSNLSKASILIPLPNSHQEDNAQYFAEKGAALVFKQAELKGDYLAKLLNRLFGEKDKLASLAKAMGEAMEREAAKKGAGLIADLLK